MHRQDLTALVSFRQRAALGLGSVLVLLWLAVPLAAQETAPDTVASMPGIEVQTSIDRAEVLVGDLVTYKLIITYDSTYELIPPPLGANLGAFDVKDYESDVLSRLPDGRRRSENTFVLSTFTTGDYRVPPIPLTFNLPDGGKKVVVSEMVPIKVKSLIEGAADTLDIKPLRKPHAFERDLTRYYLLAGAMVLGLGVLGFLLWRRYRRKEEEVEPVDTRDPWEIAFERLALLKQKGLIEEGSYKRFYLELTEITRAYLGKMYMRDVMEMTTEEFADCFREVPLPGNRYDTLRSFLNHADLVKFAKYVPESSRAEADLDVAHDIVESVRAEFERQHRARPEDGSSRPQTSGVGA